MNRTETNQDRTQNTEDNDYVKSLRENREEILEALREAYKRQYRANPNGRVVQVDFNLETEEIYTNTLIGNTEIRYEDNVINIANIKGWNAWDEGYKEENSEGETRKGYLYNEWCKHNDGFEKEENVQEMLIDDYIASYNQENFQGNTQGTHLQYQIESIIENQADTTRKEKKAQ